MKFNFVNHLPRIVVVWAILYNLGLKYLIYIFIYVNKFYSIFKLLKYPISAFSSAPPTPPTPPTPLLRKEEEGDTSENSSDESPSDESPSDVESESTVGDSDRWSEGDPESLDLVDLSPRESESEDSDSDSGYISLNNP